MMNVLVHYAEIALKGKNRSFFEHKLTQNCITALSHSGVKARAKRLSGRILLTIPTDDFRETRKRLEKVFGIANFAQVFESRGSDISQLGKEITAVLKNTKYQILNTKYSFKVDCRRADKTFSLTSHEVNEELGAYLQNTLHAKVNLISPDLTVYVEILQRNALWYYFEKVSGPSGLPTNTSGKVVSLLSGGIDSPVASFEVMKRGAKVIFLHFHSYPATSKASQTLVKEVLHVLAPWQLGATLYLVPFLDIQNKIIAFSSPSLRLLLYRRAMVKIANLLAKELGALALITGESLGQVASQTLENLFVISQTSELPIFRPLIGHDKDETIEIARRLGTYEISIKPYEDCCSFLVPRHPETKAELGEVLKEEKKIEWEGLLLESLKKAEVVKF